MEGQSETQNEYFVVGRHQPVVITTHWGQLLGLLYIPELKRRLSEILNDERDFLPLTDVVNEDGEKFEYLAINKAAIFAVREN